MIESVFVHNPNASSTQPGESAPDVSVTGFIKTVGEAGQKNQKLDFVILRDGKEIPVNDIKAIKIDAKDKNNNDRMGVGVASGFEDKAPVIAATAKDTPALNIPAAVEAALAQADVELAYDAAVCTACSPDHFSHRARGEVARQAMVVYTS